MQKSMLAAFAALAFASTDFMAFAQETSQSVTGPSTLRETYQDWTLNCTNDATGARLCEVSQEQSMNGMFALAMFISAPTDAGAAVTFLVPLGVQLSAGLALNVDEVPLVETGFEQCVQLGCVARVDMTEDSLSTMRTGEKAELIVTAPGAPQETVFTVPLSGLTAALDRLSEM